MLIHDEIIIIVIITHYKHCEIGNLCVSVKIKVLFYKGTWRMVDSVNPVRFK